MKKITKVFLFFVFQLSICQSSTTKIGAVANGGLQNILLVMPTPPHDLSKNEEIESTYSDMIDIQSLKHGSGRRTRKAVVIKAKLRIILHNSIEVISLTKSGSPAY